MRESSFEEVLSRPLKNNVKTEVGLLIAYKKASPKGR
tara:strand:- start:4500 stop:4610 length:111 start_codon:yes stop_codon:yes gene_type:complete